MLERITDFLGDIPPAWQGFWVAFIIAILRILYDAKETRKVRMLLEGLICGGLTLCASYSLEWIGVAQSLSVTIGGAIGFVGVTKIREFAFRYFTRKTK